MKITALCIVKNEEENIAKSINSYKNAVDEIIIVDTGSTDNTKSICLDLGCKVVDYQWKDDFADARNYALSLTDSDWILFLDADEYFLSPLTVEFKSCVEELEHNNVDILKILTYNIDKNTERKLNTSYGLKFFKNGKGFKYKERIHEYLDFNENDVVGVLTNDFALIHTGYSSDIVMKKPERNLQILKVKERDNDLTTKDYYYLMRESLSLNNYDEAKKYRDIFFKQNDYKEVIDTMDIGYMAYIYDYILMIKDEASYEDKINYLSKIIENYDIPDFYYNLAILYMNRDYNIAYDFFMETISSNNRLIHTDRYSNYCFYEPKIYYFLAKIEFIKKDYNKAIRHIIVACMLDKKNRLFLGLLLKICSKFKSKKVIDILYKTYNPSSKEGYEFIINGLVNTEMHEVFKHFAVIYNTEYQGGDTAVFIAMLLDKQYELSASVAYNIYRNSKDAYYLYILMIILIYANKSELYDKYYICLNDAYKNIITWYRDKNKDISVDDYNVYIDILIRLLYLDYNSFIKTLDCQLINEDNLSRIFILLEGLNKYKDIIRIFEEINEIRDSEIIGAYLLALYMTNQSDKLNNVVNKYLDSGVDIDKYLYLINLK